jgi:hypothetical protein
VLDRPTRLEIIYALQAEGVDVGADLAAIEAAVRRLDFHLAMASFDGVDLRGRHSVMWRATVGRRGSPIAVVYSFESDRAAAFEALGRALIAERRD